jgi:hypothetical protein
MRGAHGPLVQWVVLWAVVADVSSEGVKIVSPFEPVGVDPDTALSGFCPAGKFMMNPVAGEGGTIVLRCMDCAVGKYQVRKAGRGSRHLSNWSFGNHFRTNTRRSHARDAAPDISPTSR